MNRMTFRIELDFSIEADSAADALELLRQVLKDAINPLKAASSIHVAEGHTADSLLTIEEKPVQ